MHLLQSLLHHELADPPLHEADDGNTDGTATKAANSDKPINVVVFNGSLKKECDSHTQHLVNAVLKEITAIAPSAKTTSLCLSEVKFDIGLKDDVGTNDAGPKVYQLIRDADVVIFATPIWWGQPSSLIQRLVERMDGFDESYIETGTNELYKKVFGVIVTGSDDGAQACIQRLCGFATVFGFTVPPESYAFWVGEYGVGGSVSDMMKNKATMHSTKQMAANLVAFSDLIRAADAVAPIGARVYGASDK